MNIGQGLPNGVIRTSKEAAMADWATIGVSNDTKPFYLKHELGNDVTVWCINGSDGYNSCTDDDYSLQSQSECEAELQEYEGDGVTFSCGSQNGKVITESYVGFIVTEEMATVNEGMQIGTYYLRREDSEASFIENMNKIKEVFDYSNHPDRCLGDQTSSFRCSVSGLGASASSDGYVEVRGLHGCSCYVNSSGSSGCVQLL